MGHTAHRDGAADQVDVLAPTQRLHLADAQASFTGQAHRHVPITALDL